MALAAFAPGKLVLAVIVFHFLSKFQDSGFPFDLNSLTGSKRNWFSVYSVFCCCKDGNSSFTCWRWNCRSLIVLLMTWESHCLCMSEKVFFLLILNDNLSGHKIQDCQVFSFSTLKLLLYCFLAIYFCCWKFCCHFRYHSFVNYLFFLLVVLKV